MILTGTGIIAEDGIFGPEFLIAGVSSLVQYSTDGINYTSATTAGSVGTREIAYSREQNKIVCIAPGANGIYSTDNVNYSTFSNASSATWLSGLWAAELGLYVAIAVADYSGTNAVQTSADGINWTLRSVPSANDWRQVSYSPELQRLVAVASGGPGARAIYSNNGTSWSNGSINNRIWAGSCWASGLNKFVAVSATDGYIANSTDGITWTETAAPNTGEWTNVIWAHKLQLLIAVSGNGSTQSVMTSPDGTTWTLRTTPSYYGWEYVTWSDSLNLAVAVGTQGTNQSIMTSPDGINWTSRTSTTTTLLTCQAIE